MAFLEAVEAKVRRYHELMQLMSKSEVISKPALYRDYAREHGQLTKLAETHEQWLRARREKAEAERLIEEEQGELRELAEEELRAATEKEESLAEQMKNLLVAQHPDLGKDVIIEIRAGTGGEEASLFAADLFRMYTRYAERRGWKTELLERRATELGGLKQIIFAIAGPEAFAAFRHESGVHRVQRVPVTEASGRIHTSTATVAVLPEPEEVDVQISPKDLKIDTYRASGPGGQNVNKLSTAVRVEHLPTGLVVTCEDERSQHQNRAKAMRLLRSRLYEQIASKQRQERDAIRRSQIGSAERSEKIRTYNFPQNRVTDHRINLSLYNLQVVVDGDLDELLGALEAHDREARLAAL